MNDRTLVMYYFIDGLLKAMHHRYDLRTELSKSEVGTIAIGDVPVVEITNAG